MLPGAIAYTVQDNGTSPERAPEDNEAVGERRSGVA